MAISKPSVYSFLTIILLVLHLGARAQSAPAAGPAACLRAVYQLDYRLDSAIVTPKQVRMILRVSNGFSRFQNSGQYIKDSVYVNLAELPERERFTRSFEQGRRALSWDFQYSIFKEPAKDFVAYHDGINSETYQYQEKAPLFAWRITAEKKTIAGYECQQAYTTFGGRMWEAWFAREVPVSDGPYKFYGLPGLILQVRDTHDHYVFSLLCLDTNPQPVDFSADELSPFAPKSSAPIVSKAKFRRAKLNSDLTFMDRISASGNKIPESMQKDYFAELKCRNKPLERK